MILFSKTTKSQFYILVYLRLAKPVWNDKQNLKEIRSAIGMFVKQMTSDERYSGVDLLKRDLDPSRYSEDVWNMSFIRDLNYCDELAETHLKWLTMEQDAEIFSWFTQYYVPKATVDTILEDGFLVSCDGRNGQALLNPTWPVVRSDVVRSRNLPHDLQEEQEERTEIAVDAGSEHAQSGVSKLKNTKIVRKLENVHQHMVTQIASRSIRCLFF